MSRLRNSRANSLLLAELSQNGLTWANGPGMDVEIFYMAFADLNQALMAKGVLRGRENRRGWSSPFGIISVSHASGR